MEELILRIIAKVRQMYKYDNRFKDILDQNAAVELREKDGKLESASIQFCWYDMIIVCNGRIVYKPEYGCDQVLYTYDNFENFINA